MKEHWHTSIDHLFIGAVATAIIFHLIRAGAARGAHSNGIGGKFSRAVGGAFTFGGIS